MQINTVKYDADHEIMNTCENLQIVQSEFFTNKLISFILSLIWISIVLSVFRFVANEYKWLAIQLHSTIRNILSAIQWAITKVILNYLPLPRNYKVFRKKYKQQVFSYKVLLFFRKFSHQWTTWCPSYKTFFRRQLCAGKIAWLDSLT